MNKMMTAITLILLTGVGWAADQGSLTVLCGRGENKVEVDGIVKGKCGEEISLAPGSHKVRIAKRGNYGDELYIQQVTIEEKKNLALTAEFKKASELDDSIGTPLFPPQKALNEMQVIDRKIKQLREKYRTDLKSGINKIVADSYPRYVKLADAKKDEFESETEFKEKVHKERNSLDSKQSADIIAIQSRLESEYTQQIVPFIEDLKMLSAKEFTITAENLNVELGIFNGDNNTYPVVIKAKKPLELLLEEGMKISKQVQVPAPAKVAKKGKSKVAATPVVVTKTVIEQIPPKFKYIELTTKANIPLPREEAREFKQRYQNNTLKAELKGNFVTPEVFNVTEARIIDSATMKSYNLFTSTFVDLGNDTIYDTTSKLIWRKSGSLPNTLEWNAANNAIIYLNNYSHLGFKDWKLPSKSELDSLVVHGKEAGFGKGGKTIAGFLNNQGFSDVQPGLYWSSTETGNNNDAYNVSLDDGEEHNGNYGRHFKGNKFYDYYVWPVRVALNDKYILWTDNYSFRNSNLIDLDNNIIFDLSTKLIWTKDANLFRTAMSKSDANKSCKQLIYSNIYNWRLPSDAELVNAHNNNTYGGSNYFYNIVAGEYYGAYGSILQGYFTNVDDKCIALYKNNSRYITGGCSNFSLNAWCVKGMAN